MPDSGADPGRLRLLVVHPPGAAPGLDPVLEALAASGHEVVRLLAGPVDAAFPATIAGLLKKRPPDLVLAHGCSPAARVALHLARLQDRATLLLLDDDPGTPEPFESADRTLVTSTWLAERLRARWGVVAEVLPTVVADAQVDAASRGFLAIVDPTPDHGGAIFTRLALMLASARPDIPMLLVNGVAPSELPGIEPAAEQILASRPIDTATLCGLARVLVVPWINEDGAARLVAEAARHGVPAVVSDRGALPEVLGSGGIVVPLPPIVLRDPRRIPGESETADWLDAAVRVWDDAERFGAIAASNARRHGPTGVLPAYEALFRAHAVTA